MSHTTYTRVLLVLCSDGSSRAYTDPRRCPLESCNAFHGADEPHVKRIMNAGLLATPSEEIEPTASGNDRGPFRTYELGGYSIDVAQMVQQSQHKSQL